MELVIQEGNVSLSSIYKELPQRCENARLFIMHPFMICSAREKWWFLRTFDVKNKDNHGNVGSSSRISLTVLDLCIS